MHTRIIRIQYNLLSRKVPSKPLRRGADPRSADHDVGVCYTKMQIRSLDRSNLFLFFEKIYDVRSWLPPKSHRPTIAVPVPRTREKNQNAWLGLAHRDLPRLKIFWRGEIWFSLWNWSARGRRHCGANHSIPTLVLHNAHPLKFEEWMDRYLLTALFILSTQ